MKGSYNKNESEVGGHLGCVVGVPIGCRLGCIEGWTDG